MTKTVIGVDGCRAGWIAVIWQSDTSFPKFFPKFSNLLDFAKKPENQIEAIAVDIPVGIRNGPARAAERCAREVLKGKTSSVFPVPSRAVVEEIRTFTDDYYRIACSINYANTLPPKRLAKQSFNIISKIQEVDLAVTPATQQLVYEVHPELSFSLMNNGHAVKSRKSKSEGVLERERILVRNGFPLFDFRNFEMPKKLVAYDDLLDACACAWSARRIMDRIARHFPETEERDARGLLMRIHA